MATWTEHLHIWVLGALRFCSHLDGFILSLRCLKQAGPVHQIKWLVLSFSVIEFTSVSQFSRFLKMLWRWHSCVPLCDCTHRGEFLPWVAIWSHHSPSLNHLHCLSNNFLFTVYWMKSSVFNLFYHTETGSVWMHPIPSMSALSS